MDVACIHSVGAADGAYVEASVSLQLLQIVGVGLIFSPSPSLLLSKGNFDGRIFWVDGVLRN